MCFFGAIAHQSSMQELDFLNPQIDPRISYSGGPKMFFGPAGLLQESRGNFITASEDFTAGIWARNTGVTVSANAAQAPNGAMTADAVTYDGTGVAGSFRIYTAVLNAAPAGLQACSSIWLRSNTPITLKLSSNQNSRTYLITSTWQRVDCPFAGNGVVNWQLAIYSATGDNTPFTIYMWGAQAEKGSFTPGYYLPTFGAVAYEWPLEYDPITLKPIGRSVWEQRTNLLIWSDDFSNAAWEKGDITVTSNTGTGADGAQSADKLVPTATSSNFHYVRQSYGSATVGTTYTSSFVVSEAGYTTCALRQLGTDAPIVNFDLVAGTCDNAAGKIKALGGGRYRVSLTGVATGTFLWAYLYPKQQTTFSGDGVMGIYAGAAQFEAGANASPYIPTASSQVTRVSDLPRIEGVGTLRFNPAVGSLFVDFTVGGERGDAYPAHVVGFGDVADNSVFRGSAVYDNRLTVGFLAPAANIPQYANMTGARVKVAQSYVGGAALTEKNAAIDGVARIAAWNGSGSLNTATVGRLAIGWSGRAITRDRFMAGWVRSIRYYPSDLAPAELQALTA